jgi:CheY-like chemotaxis protein
MSGSRVRILIVEDEMVVALSLKAVIEELGHEAAHIAITGDEAISYVNGSAPDLILMDITLAGDMDGIEAARRINRDHDVPIVFLTGYSDSDTLSRIEDVAHQVFLKKPAREDVLREAIQDALRGR